MHFINFSHSESCKLAGAGKTLILLKRAELDSGPIMIGSSKQIFICSCIYSNIYSFDRTGCYKSQEKRAQVGKPSKQ